MKENLSALTAILEDQELMTMFERVALKNGRTPKEVLSSFIKDYIVSNGRPELVGEKFSE